MVSDWDFFASINISKGETIVEFKGTLRANQKEYISKIGNIGFENGTVLECDVNDLASKAKDALLFPTIQRPLMATLQSSEPFYRKHPNAKINAEIGVNTKTHRAFLFAIDNIKKNKEIFGHYGFTYWFDMEKKTIDFLPDTIDNEKKISIVFPHPALVFYIQEFYPDASTYKFTDIKIDGTFHLKIFMEDRIIDYHFCDFLRKAHLQFSPHSN